MKTETMIANFLHVFLPLTRKSEKVHIILEWHIRSTQQTDLNKCSCFVSLSQRDLTVVMVTQCESTKEVTDNIDMTNLFSSYFVPLFLLSLPLRHPLCICGTFVPRARVGLVANPSTSPSPPLSDCTAHPFSPHASPPPPVSDKCLYREVSALNHISLCSPLRYQQDNKRSQK